MNKKLFDFKALGRIYNDVDLNSYTVNVDAFIINGVVIATTDLNSDLIDDLENSMLEAIYNAGLPSAGLNLTVINNNNGTFTVTFTLPSSYYAGIDYGLVSGNYTASAMSYQTPGVPGILRFGTSHEILIPENGNALLNEVYFFRLSVGTSSYVDSGYVTSEQTISLDDVAPILSSANAGTPTITGTNGARVTTDTASGVLYWAVVTNGGSCTDAQLKAGTGGNIVPGVSGSVTVTTSLITIPSITGLVDATTYQIKFLQTDANGNDSSQVSVSLTTTSIAATFDLASVATMTNSTSATFSHTIGGGSNRLLVVMPQFLYAGALRTVSSVTYNGVALTQHSGSAVDATGSGGTRTAADVWYLKEANLPAAGTYNVVITMAGGSARIGGGAVSAYNVNQTTPLGTAVTNTATSNDLSIDVTGIASTVDDLVIAATGVQQNSAAAVPSNTSMWSVQDTFNSGWHYAQRAPGQAVTTNMTWTQGSGSNQGWCAVGVAIKGL